MGCLLAFPLVVLLAGPTFAQVLPSASQAPPTSHTRHHDYTFGQGYYQADSQGGVYAWGNATSYGSVYSESNNSSHQDAQAWFGAKVVAITGTNTVDSGYWVVSSNGWICSFRSVGNAAGGTWYPTTYNFCWPELSGVSDIVGAVATGDNGGIFLVGSDGGVFAFGDAAFEGSEGSSGLHTFAGIAVDGDAGYWLVTSAGAVYSFNLPYHGGLSSGPSHPIVGFTGYSTTGYWMAGTDGGIYAFPTGGGGAPFEGSTGSTALPNPVVGMAASPDLQGYWIGATDGGLFAFGDAIYNGSMLNATLANGATMVGIADSV